MRERDLVRHRARRHVERGLLAEQLGDALLQRVHRRVLAVDVVADVGVGHRLAHRGEGWSRYRSGGRRSCAAVYHARPDDGTGARRSRERLCRRRACGVAARGGGGGRSACRAPRAACARRARASAAPCRACRRRASPACARRCRHLEQLERAALDLAVVVALEGDEGGVGVLVDHLAAASTRTKRTAVENASPTAYGRSLCARACAGDVAR